MIVIVSEVIEGDGGDVPGRSALVDISDRPALSLRCHMLGLQPPVMAAIVAPEFVGDFPEDGIGRILTDDEMRAFLEKQAKRFPDLLKKKDRPS